MGNTYYVIGIDEAGMAPMAGPLTAAVVAIPVLNDGLPGVKDSKRLKDKRREELIDSILDLAVLCENGVRTAEEIDEVGISRAWTDLIRELAQKAHERFPDGKIILDGNRLVGLPYVEPIVKADAKYLVVSAASNIAKYTQCCWMDSYHLRYPQYGFDSHRGYPTPQHLKALKEHGPCPIHRKTFRPVREVLHSLESGSRQLWA